VLNVVRGVVFYISPTDQSSVLGSQSGNFLQEDFLGALVARPPFSEWPIIRSGQPLADASAFMGSNRFRGQPTFVRVARDPAAIPS